MKHKIWKGSVHKAVLPEACAYGTLFGILMLVYNFLLNASQKKVFEDFCEHCRANQSLIPISFVLGFYVNLVVSRWWAQFLAVPWPDTISIYVTAYVDSKTDEARYIRKKLIRYINLSYVMCLRNISTEANTLYGSDQQLISEGLATEAELASIREHDCEKNKLLMPILWATNTVITAAKDGFITGIGQQNELLNLILEYREKIRTLYTYIWINPPLIYTQIATITVYVYCLMKIFSEQISGKDVDGSFLSKIFIYMFGYLEFTFYMGWLKVAESLINPFGDDEEDFNIQPIIERHLRVTNITIDDLCHQCPPIRKDLLWNDKEIKFTDSEDESDDSSSGEEMFHGTVANVHVDKDNISCGSLFYV